MEILDELSPFKNKYLRARHSKFVTKERRKAMMLRNQFLEAKTNETRMKSNKQRSICVSISGKAARSFYENIDLKEGELFASHESLVTSH